MAYERAPCAEPGAAGTMCNVGMVGPENYQRISQRRVTADLSCYPPTAAGWHPRGGSDPTAFQCGPGLAGRCVSLEAPCGKAQEQTALVGQIERDDVFGDDVGPVNAALPHAELGEIGVLLWWIE